MLSNNLSSTVGYSYNTSLFTEPRGQLTGIDDTRSGPGNIAQSTSFLNGALATVGSRKTIGGRAAGATALSTGEDAATVLGLNTRESVDACERCVERYTSQGARE